MVADEPSAPQAEVTAAAAGFDSGDERRDRTDTAARGPAGRTVEVSVTVRAVRQSPSD